MKSMTAVDLNLSLSAILENHLQNSQREKGLLLLTLPTGFGKTHYVLDYIANHLKNDYEQRIWFITNLKKNLPQEKLKQRLGEDLYNQKVLFLDNYVDSVKVFFQNYEGEVPKLFSEWKYFKNLKNQIGSIASFKKIKDKKLENLIYEQASKAEREFRIALSQKLISEKYFPKKATIKDRLSIIRSNKKLQWIEKMYPSVQYHEKQIIFCSIDKFYTYVHPIISPNVQITTIENIENDIVFIDEFDATKSNILKLVVENARKFNQDILGLFIQIFRGITERPNPTETNILKGLCPKKIKKIDYRFSELLKDSKEIFQKYNFEYHFYHQSREGKERAFLFHDFQYHTVLSGKPDSENEKFMVRSLDKEGKINRIKIQDFKPKRDEENLLIMLNRLRGFIGQFASFISKLAKDYKELHDESKTDAAQISLEHAIRTALAEFDLRDTTLQRYFIDTIFHQTNVLYNNSFSQFDQSPLSQGFRFYDIINRQSHNTISNINFVNTMITPEGWLLDLCNKANVIGISATASFDSPLSNYSLAHLSHHLADNFHTLSSLEKESLKREFELKQEFAEQREIKTIPITTSSKKEKALKEIFDEEELVSFFENKFLDLDIPPFEVTRYVQVAKVYSYFIENQDIHSFLCLLNKFPKKKGTFRKSLLVELLGEVRSIKLNEAPEEAIKNVETDLFILRSSTEFDTDVDKVNEILGKGGKVFLISTYQTIGAGQNLQYKFPKNIPVIAVHNQSYGDNEKDYDGIFLEKPTHLLGYFNDEKEMTTDDMLKYLFEVEYLFDGGAINVKQKKERIEYAFRRRFNPKAKKPNNGDIKKSKIVSQHYCRVIIQAVGRLSRTKFKSPVTHILFDNGIEEYLQNFDISRKLLVPEFLAIHSACQQGNSRQQNTDTELQRRNIHNSFYLGNQFRRLVKRIPDWSKKEILFWADLRQFVLKNPTISKDKLRKSGLLRFYISSPKGELINYYFYSSNDDFHNDLKISFDTKIGREVSAEGIELDKILAISEIRELFNKNSWATTFEMHEFMMSPPLFKNIYLGALGEEIGKFLLEQYCPNLKLRELEKGEYELFDFKIDNGIYVDFKFWKETNHTADAKTQKEKIQRKMQRCGAKKVFIINILNENHANEPVIGTDGIIEIPRLINLKEQKIDFQSFLTIQKNLV